MIAKRQIAIDICLCKISININIKQIKWNMCVIYHYSHNFQGHMSILRVSATLT